MKSIFIFLIALFISVTGFSQDTIHVENNYHDGQLNEVYTRNSAGQKVGPYTRYSRFGKMYISGHYKEGLPVGIWQFYSSDTSGILVQTLDFDLHKELFVDPYHVTSIICGPRYFGGTMMQNEYIARCIKTNFSDAERAQLRGQVYVLIFTIDNKTFKPVGITIDDPSVTEPLKGKLLKIASEMPAWLPPVCKDKTEVWRFSVAVSF